jgi:hypothetical protein
MVPDILSEGRRAADVPGMATMDPAVFTDLKAVLHPVEAWGRYPPVVPLCLYNALSRSPASAFRL